jgi:hypothetical protein
MSNGTALDVNPEHLLTAFRAVSPHRGTDKLLPVFLDVKVRIERESKTVSVTATDRYTIARDTVVTSMSSQWEDDANGRPWADLWEWTFSPDQVKTIMGLCRDSIKAKHPVIPLFPVLGLGNESELEVGYDRERFRSTGASWPKVDHILGKPLHDDETNPPARLRSFRGRHHDDASALTSSPETPGRDSGRESCACAGYRVRCTYTYRHRRHRDLPV